MKRMVFDVGGTEIKYALMDEELNMSGRGYIRTPLESFTDFADAIYGIYAQHKDETDGIAMSLPGFVDTEKGRVNGGGVLLYNHGTDVGPLLEERCGCRVVLVNDGKAAALAEYARGSLQGCRNAAVFVIGTGVGGGLIIDGKLVTGKHFTAGEYSFVNIDRSCLGTPQSCMGNVCSTTGLLRRYEEATGEAIDGREFFRRLPEDEIAQKALDDFAMDVAYQIYNLYWLLDLEKIAIGGGISRQPILCEKIREKFNLILEGWSFREDDDIRSVEIMPARFGNEANMIGAFMTYQNRMGN